LAASRPGQARRLPYVLAARARPGRNFAHAPLGKRHQSKHVECAGRAKRRRRFRIADEPRRCGSRRAGESGVALRLPPQSKQLISVSDINPPKTIV